MLFRQSPRTAVQRPPGTRSPRQAGHLKSAPLTLSFRGRAAQGTELGVGRDAIANLVGAEGTGWFPEFLSSPRIAASTAAAEGGRGPAGAFAPSHKTLDVRVEGGGASGGLWCPTSGPGPAPPTRPGPARPGLPERPPRPHLRLPRPHPPLGDRARGASRSPEKAARRVTQAPSPQRGQMRSLTSARPHERDREKRKNKASANLLFWALCELARFPAYRPPLNGAEHRSALPQLRGVFTGC